MKKFFTSEFISAFLVTMGLTLVFISLVGILELKIDEGAEKVIASVEKMEKKEANLPEVIEVEATATGYCPCEKCCGKFADGMTSIGRSVELYPYGIAADPSVIPYGTVVEVPGYGRVEVDDTGAAMKKSKGIRIDLRFETHERALKWGRRNVTLEIDTHGLSRDEIENLKNLSTRSEKR